MKPVVTALHAIAAIERETREAQTEAASAGRSETILSQDLSQSSPVFRGTTDMGRTRLPRIAR